jgi:hypothetical protein
MVFHMKTTLIIHDNVMKRLREEAAKRDTTISELVEAALRLMLEPRQRERKVIEPLPVHDLGGVYVDVANRDALYQAMEGG